MAQRLFTYPDPDIGYWHGLPPRYGGDGAGQGPHVAGSVTGVYSDNGTTGPGGNKWHPTVAYLFGLVIVEVIVFGLLRKFTRHGG